MGLEIFLSNLLSQGLELSFMGFGHDGYKKYHTRIWMIFSEMREQVHQHVAPIERHAFVETQIESVGTYHRLVVFQKGDDISLWCFLLESLGVWGQKCRNRVCLLRIYAQLFDGESPDSVIDRLGLMLAGAGMRCAVVLEALR